MTSERNGKLRHIGKSVEDDFAGTEPAPSVSVAAIYPATGNGAELFLKCRKDTKRKLTNKRVETRRKRAARLPVPPHERLAATRGDRLRDTWGRRWC